MQHSYWVYAEHIHCVYKQRTQDTCIQNINNKRGTILPVFSQNNQIQNALIKDSLWDGEKLKAVKISLTNTVMTEKNSPELSNEFVIAIMI